MRYIVFFILFTSLGFFACKKVKGPGSTNAINTNTDSTVFMTTTINGSKWTTDSTTGYTIQLSGNDSGFYDYNIIATNRQNSTSINLYITSFTGIGTYLINPPAVTATYYDAANMRHFASSGQIAITVDSGNAITGTFNFVADTINAVNGSFNVAN